MKWNPSHPFPDPRRAPKHGLLAIGGDLSPPLLLKAYDHGIFPWFNEGELPHWWSPDPRAVMDIESLHVSRSLNRTLRSGRFRVTWNQCFQRTMEECANGRDDGTWILSEMIEAYSSLHLAGHAHSIEVWLDEQLAGGLYGVQRGGAFMAESMFHRVTDASKIALVEMIRGLWVIGMRLFDVQFLTPHLESMGAYEISRNDYLRRLENARMLEIDLCRDLPRSLL